MYTTHFEVIFIYYTAYYRSSQGFELATLPKQLFSRRNHLFLYLSYNPTWVIILSGCERLFHEHLKRGRQRFQLNNYCLRSVTNKGVTGPPGEQWTVFWMESYLFGGLLLANSVPPLAENCMYRNAEWCVVMCRYHWRRIEHTSALARVQLSCCPPRTGPTSVNPHLTPCDNGDFR